MERSRLSPEAVADDDHQDLAALQVQNESLRRKLEQMEKVRAQHVLVY